MGEELDPATLLAVYRLVLGRYKDLINDKESRSISEIRARTSPYTDFIRRVSADLMKDTVPYDYARHFPTALERSLAFLRSIRTCEFAFTFWMSFEEMERIALGTSLDKALLLCALLRSFESPDASVVVTRADQWLVRFSFDGLERIVLPATGSVLSGEDAAAHLSKDRPKYIFNDISFEDLED